MRLSGRRPAAGLALALLFSLPAAPAAGDGPAGWEVRLRVETEGRYALAGLARDISGTFAYEAVWTGLLERDDPDFRLFHIGQETVRWELEERSGKEPEAASLREADIPVRPHFHVKYVLAEGGRVRFVFTVEGFPVPRGEAPEAFDLLLPRSRREAAPAPQDGYDGGILKGSNDVSVDEKAFREGALKRVFRWSWKRYQPSANPPPAGPLFSAHEVKVTLVVTPRGPISTFQHSRTDA